MTTAVSKRLMMPSEKDLCFVNGVSPFGCESPLVNFLKPNILQTPGFDGLRQSGLSFRRSTKANS